MRTPAIVLAAGASRRLGRPKQLVEVGGEALLARTVRVALESGAAPVYVILGAQADEIRARLPLPGATTIVNPEWEAGMSTSLRAGVNAVLAGDSGAPGVLLLACDQPRLTAEHLAELLRRAASNTDVIVASAYAGVRGVPAVFPRAQFEALQALRGDKGARALLANASKLLVDVSFDGGDLDIDVPADLEQLK